MKKELAKLRIALIYWAQQRSNFKTEGHFMDGMPILTLMPVKDWWSKLFPYKIFRWERVAFVRENDPPYITLYFPNKELELFLEEFMSSEKDYKLTIKHIFHLSSKKKEE